jgi:hypothetical protein
MVSEEPNRGSGMRKENKMKYLVKRTEVFESDSIIGYLQESGIFGNKSTARVFADREKAEDYIDTERCDPIYDKAFMGECTFEIEEIGVGFGRSKASAKYNESNVKQIKMNINRKTDADIIEHLSRCENVQGYIKSLIRKDMEV